MNSKIIMGTFDPETRWRDSNLARLPAMPDKERESIVLCMDELLFAFCQTEDVLFSRCKIDLLLKEYLYGIGFSFQTRYIFNINDDEEPLPDPEHFKRCMFRLAADQAGSHPISNETMARSSTYRLSPYAITADTEAYLYAAGTFAPLPDLETTVRVNSKMYSNRLLEMVGEKSYGTEVNSAAEMERIGRLLLEHRAYLIKDPFGVSGKGNLLIDSEPMHRRIAEYLHKQELVGLRCHFLLEPLLNKETDFSSHWFIREDGEKEFISIQRMINHQQNYSGSVTAEDSFIEHLELAGYFGVMEKALQHLAGDGYHGFVCFDSMILRDGEIVPIVEINARKSMGLINAYLDKHWAAYGLSGCLTFLSLGLPEGFEIGKLLQSLRLTNLWVARPGDYGVVPLSSNTLMINEILTRRRISNGYQNKRGMTKGRLYVNVIGRDDEHRSELIKGLRQLLTELSVKVYN